MDEACLTKLKDLVSDDVYNLLDTALKAGDNYAWDKTMIDAHADVQFIKRQAILDANLLNDAIETLQTRTNTWLKAKGLTLNTERGRKAYAKEASRTLSDMISGVGARQRANMMSLEKHIEGIRGPAMSNLTELLHNSRPLFMGLTRKGGTEFSRTLIRSIYGSVSIKATPEMQAIAKAWNKVTTSMLERFNRAGGDIKSFDEFNLQVNHDVGKISKATREEWKRDARNLFNIRKPDNFKGKWDEDTLLNSAYDNLSTAGVKPFDAKEATQSGGVKLGNAHQQWRYLQPKDGDAWLEYNSKYGRHNHPIDAMVEYISNMSTSIGLMETLGSNPTRAFDNLVAHVQKTTKNPNAGRQAQASLDQIVAGKLDPNTWTVNTLRAFRHFQTAAKLGMAPITALSDVAYSAVSSAYLGINPIKTFAKHMKLLSPMGRADRKLAGRMGLTMEYALSRAAALNRYTDNIGYGIFHKVADMSTRASGLNLWTHSGKTAFGLEMLANLGGLAKTNKLSKGMKHAFERYGISEADWQIIRTARDGDYIDITKLGVEHERLQSKFIGMISEETNFAIPEPNAKARATTQLYSKRNTIANELIKTATQFKSFGVSVALSHMGRMLNDTTTVPARVVYGSSLLVGTAAMGMAVIQLKDIAKGREPREMSPSLVGESILQGGMLGVLGDIMFKDPSLFGGTQAYLLGPTVSDLANLGKYFWEIKDETLAKDFATAWYTELVPGAVKGADMAIPFANKLWYTRLMWEKAILNRVNEMTDPNYHKKQANTRKWLMEERGQQMWVD